MNSPAPNQLPASVTDPAPAPDAEPLSMPQVLGLLNFRRLWYAQIVSVFGDFLALFAVITYMTFQLHATAQQITGVQLAYLLPLAVLGVLSGVFVDRWPVQATLVGSDYIRAALVLLLLVVHSIFGFYLVLAAISVLSSFFYPAQGIALRATVPMHGLRSANALMGQVYYIMRIVGPSVATLLVHRFGPPTCYVLDTASFLGSGTLILSLRLLLPPTVREPHPLQAELSGMGLILADMREATYFILHHAVLLFIIFALCACMFVLGCSGPLIAIYVRDVLHASSATFALVFAMIGLGLLLSVNALNTLGRSLSSTVQIFGGLSGIALGTLVLAALHTTVTAVLGCLLIGVSAAGILVPTQTLLQQLTPVELLGRVGSTANAAVVGAQVIGLLLSGWLTALSGIRTVFAVSTALLAALVLVGWRWMQPANHPALS